MGQGGGHHGGGSLPIGDGLSAPANLDGFGYATQGVDYRGGYGRGDPGVEGRCLGFDGGFGLNPRPRFGGGGADALLVFAEYAVEGEEDQPQKAEDQEYHAHSDPGDLQPPQILRCQKGNSAHV